MILKGVSLYRPFKDFVLGFLLKESFPSGNVTGCVLEEINLYHQPVAKPMLAALFSCIMITILILAEYLHIKIFKMLKKDKSVLKDITYTFVIGQVILCPLFMFLMISTNFIYPLHKVIGQWFCTISRFIVYFLFNITFSHSCFAALMRYVFIVYSKKAELYGKKKVKRWFLLLSILIPLIITIWKVNDGSELDALSFINKCNGKDHEVFLVEISTLHVLKKSFCGFGGSKEKDVFS